jgi:hypothetical protein
MVEKAIIRDDFVKIVDHPNQKKYPGQKIFYIEIDGYIHSVPFIETQSGKVFLKTMYRSRKVNKSFKRKGKK